VASVGVQIERRAATARPQSHATVLHLIGSGMVPGKD
jgi:hypothetical protein